jgi:hypothetical protein
VLCSHVNFGGSQNRIVQQLKLIKDFTIPKKHCRVMKFNLLVFSCANWASVTEKSGASTWQ